MFEAHCALASHFPCDWGPIGLEAVETVILCTDKETGVGNAVVTTTELTSGEGGPAALGVGHVIVTV